MLRLRFEILIRKIRFLKIIIRFINLAKKFIILFRKIVKIKNIRINRIIREIKFKLKWLLIKININIRFNTKNKWLKF